MLLAALHEYAQRENLLSGQGFETAPVRWIISLHADGSIIGNGPVDTATSENKRGREYRVPVTARAKNSGGAAEFLADGLTAIFGVEADPSAERVQATAERRSANNRKKFDEFWLLLKEAARSTDLTALGAALAFKEQLHGGSPPFLRWGPDRSPATKEQKEKWWVTTADGSEAELRSGDRFTFEVEGRLLLDESALRGWWSEQAARERASEREESEHGLCLVTGRENAEIARTHAGVSGVPGASPMGAKLVAFDKDAFCSFGFSQGRNAPICVEARDGYAAALESLLRDPHHHMRIGGAVAVWWTRGGVLDCMGLLDEPTPESVAAFLRAPWGGRAPASLDEDEFFSVVLSGNKARVAVRHWVREPLRLAVGSLERWFEDLRIESLPANRKPNPKYRPLALYFLACTTVREAKDLRQETVLGLYRAATEGVAPSPSLLAPVLSRLSVGLAKEGNKALSDESRFALLKLLVNRNRKEREPMIETALTETNDPAYNCGRLLAVLQALQDRAHDFKLEGPGVSERYYGAASTAPGSVLPFLLRLGRSHLRKLQHSEKTRVAARAIEQRIGDVLARFEGSAGASPSFPPFLGLAEQGRFALGFYQQSVHDRRQAQERKAASHPIE